MKNINFINSIKSISSLTIDFKKNISDILDYISMKDLLSLPNIELKDIYYYRDNLIPRNICGIYFLIHEKMGILYIGKSIELKGRWSYCYASDKPGHHLLIRSLNTGNVKLCWLEMDKLLSTMIEPILIDYFKPRWNGKIK